jgi:hypothetical protein
MKRLFWLVFALGLGRAFGADATIEYASDSPDKRFHIVWSINPARKISNMKIVSSTDPAGKPLFEEIGDAPATDGTRPPFVDVWWSNDSRLAIYQIGTETGVGTQAVARFYAWQEARQDSPARFVPITNNPKVYPVFMEDEVTDRVIAQVPDAGQFLSGGFHTTNRWKASRAIETDCRMDFWIESKSGHAKRHYDTKWTATNQLTADGFVFGDLGPISYALRDSADKEGAWLTLPITDQDWLRIAVRLNQEGNVSVLLNKGVNPNADPVANLAALAARKSEAEVLVCLLRAKVDLNRNPGGRWWSVENAILAKDPGILQEMLKGKPDGKSETSSDLYEDLVWTMPRTEAYADTLGKYGPVDDEAAFLRKLQLLVAAKYDINAADEKTGKTALVLAVEAHFSTKLIQAMLTAGADPNKKDGEGKSAADIAADTQQLPVLRLLDTRHHYVDLLKSYEIPANSPLVGTWTAGEDMYLTLSADGTGNLASMFASLLTWKEKQGVAEIEFHPLQARDPNLRMTGSAKLGADKDTLLLTMNGPGRPLEETLHRDKSK